MDYHGVELLLASLRRTSSYDEAYTVLEPLLAATGDVRAFALVQRALTLHSQSLRNAHKCLELTDEALSQTEDVAIVQRALMNGYVYGRISCDTDRTKRYISEMKVIIERVDQESNLWLGRLIHTVGDYEQQMERYDNAINYQTRSLRWHQENVGPYKGTEYGERDQRCYIGLSVSSLGELYHKLNRIDQLERMLRVARKYLAESRPDILFYLQGLVQTSKGDLVSASTFMHEALVVAQDKKNHLFTMKVVEALAGLYRILGDAKRLETLLKPYIVECAHGRLVVQVLRLQRLSRI
jgi:tetratricopeptide (TPR) repeat protein